MMGSAVAAAVICATPITDRPFVTLPAIPSPAPGGLEGNPWTRQAGHPAGPTLGVSRSLARPPRLWRGSNPRKRAPWLACPAGRATTLPLCGRRRRAAQPPAPGQRGPDPPADAGAGEDLARGEQVLGIVPALPGDQLPHLGGTQDAGGFMGLEQPDGVGMASVPADPILQGGQQLRGLAGGDPGGCHRVEG